MPVLAFSKSWTGLATPRSRQTQYDCLKSLPQHAFSTTELAPAKRPRHRQAFRVLCSISIAFLVLSFCYPPALKFIMRRSNIYSILKYASYFPFAFFQDVSASPLQYQTLTGESPNSEVSAEELFQRSLSTSPSVGPNFPDPCIININGKWYAFATRTIGSGINVPVASSPDYKTWTIMTNSSGGTYDALPTMPPWVDTTPNQWAPDVGQLVRTPQNH